MQDLARKMPSLKQNMYDLSHKRLYDELEPQIQLAHDAPSIESKWTASEYV